MADSTHKVEIVPIKLEPHPNADKLSLVKIHGYTCVVNTNDWAGKDEAAYVCPDSLVDTKRPEFAFLGDRPRITVRRFRGIFSQGLLVPAPEGSQIGDDVAEQLGVTKYEPIIKFNMGDEESPPPGFIPKY